MFLVWWDFERPRQWPQHRACVSAASGRVSPHGSRARPLLLLVPSSPGRAPLAVSPWGTARDGPTPAPPAARPAGGPPVRRPRLWGALPRPPSPPVPRLPSRPGRPPAAVGRLDERPLPASVRRPRLLAAPSGRGGRQPAVSRQGAAAAGGRRGPWGAGTAGGHAAGTPPGFAPRAAGQQPWGAGTGTPAAGPGPRRAVHGRRPATPTGAPMPRPPGRQPAARGGWREERERRAQGRSVRRRAAHGRVASQRRTAGGGARGRGSRGPGRGAPEADRRRLHAGRPLQGVPPQPRGHLNHVPRATTPQGNDSPGQPRAQGNHVPTSTTPHLNDVPRATTSPGQRLPTSTTCPGQPRLQANDVPTSTTSRPQRRPDLNDVPTSTTCPGQPRAQANDSPGQRLPRATTCPGQPRAQANHVPRATVCPPQSRVAGEAAGGRAHLARAAARRQQAARVVRVAAGPRARRAGQWAGDAWRVRRPLSVGLLQGQGARVPQGHPIVSPHVAAARRRPWGAAPPAGHAHGAPPRRSHLGASPPRWGAWEGI